MPTKAILTTLAAMSILVLAVGSASAQRLSSSETRIRAIWRDLDFVSGIGTIECPITLSGSFHKRTIVKIARSLIGAINNAQLGAHSPTAGGCTNGGGTINRASLPWHILYDSFRGRLPTIESITLLLVGGRSEFDAGEVGPPICNSTETAANPARAIAALTASGLISSVTADMSAVIPVTGEGICAFAGNGRYGGAGIVDNQAGALVTIRLI